MSHGRGMLGRADGVAAGVETSITLGAHHPGLPTGAIFFQHPVECRFLADDLVAGRIGNGAPPVSGINGGGFAFNPDSPGSVSAATFDPATPAGIPGLAGPSERSFGRSHLGHRLCRQHGGMAGTENEIAPGWDLGGVRLVRRPDTISPGQKRRGKP